MALYNEILVGRFARGIQKLFGTKGGVPVKQLAGDVTVIHPLRNGNENRYLEGWNLFGATLALAASAGNVSAIRWRNPGTSNAIAVLTKILLLNNSSALQQYNATNGPIAADLTTVVAGAGPRFDTRGNQNSVLIASTQQSAAIAGLTNTFCVAFIGNVAGAVPSQDLLLFEEHEIPLLPGDAVQFTSVNQNVPETAVMFWRERFLEEGERF